MGSRQHLTSNHNNIIKGDINHAVVMHKKRSMPPPPPQKNHQVVFPLDCDIWNKVEAKVYEDRLNTPFEKGITKLILQNN